MNPLQSLVCGVDSAPPDIARRVLLPLSNISGGRDLTGKDEPSGFLAESHNVDPAAAKEVRKKFMLLKINI
jgi:hypothetical protein